MIIAISIYDFDNKKQPDLTRAGKSSKTANSPKLPRNNNAFLLLHLFKIASIVACQLLSKHDPGHQEAGEHSFVWDAASGLGASFSSGVYLYRITAGKYSATDRITRVR